MNAVETDCRSAKWIITNHYFCSAAAFWTYVNWKFNHEDSLLYFLYYTLAISDKQILENYEKVSCNTGRSIIYYIYKETKNFSFLSLPNDHIVFPPFHKFQ